MLKQESFEMTKYLEITYKTKLEILIKTLLKLEKNKINVEMFLH